MIIFLSLGGLIFIIRYLLDKDVVFPKVYKLGHSWCFSAGGKLLHTHANVQLGTFLPHVVNVRLQPTNIFIITQCGNYFLV